MALLNSRKRKSKLAKLVSAFSAFGCGAAILWSSATVSLAEGGFSQPTASSFGGATASNSGNGNTGAESSGGIVVESGDVNYTSSVSSIATANNNSFGNDAWVIVGSNTEWSTGRAAEVEQHGSSRTTVFTKNGGVLAKGRANVLTTITIGGRPYLVSVEVAKAVARSTPYGTSSATSTEQNVSVYSNSYSVSTANTDKTNRGN